MLWASSLKRKSRIQPEKFFELSESHTEKLIPTGKSLDLVVAIVPLNAFPKFMDWEKFHELSINGFARVHYKPSLSVVVRKYGFLNLSFSNRLRPFLP